MGKKGKMSVGREEGSGKGSHNAMLRDMHTSIEYARKMAYDHQAISAKRMEQARNQRKKLIFPHLNSLLMQRSRDDVRGGAIPGVVGTTYDRSWEEYFIRQGTKDQRAASAETITKNTKKRYCSWLLPVSKERVIPTLVSLCIRSIAKSLPLFVPEDVQFALSTVNHEKTEQLSMLSSIGGTLHDEHTISLQHDLLERLYLSEHITDHGVNKLLTCMQSTVNTHFQNLDSWETIDLSILQPSTCLNLFDVTFLSSAISTVSLTAFSDHCPHLHRLCLYDVQFHTEAQQNDPIVFCLQVLDLFNTGFLSLVTLELHYCHWLRLHALTMWAIRVEGLRAVTDTKQTLAKCKYLTISGIDDYLTEQYVAALNEPELPEAQEQEWGPVHPLFAVAGVSAITNSLPNAVSTTQTNNSTSSSNARRASIVTAVSSLFHTKLAICVSIEM